MRDPGMKAVRSWAVTMALAAGAFSATAGPAAAQNMAQARTVAAQSAQVDVARFWRGDGVTLLEGVVSILVGAGSTANPQVELVIMDNAGKALHTESWTDTVSQQ